MVKVSISLPNNAQITFESEESEALHEIIGLALRDLPRDLMQSAMSDGGDASAIVASGTAEKSTAISEPASTTLAAPAEPIAPPAVEPANAPEETLASSPPVEAPAQPEQNDNPADTTDLPPEFLSETGRASFEAFCREANPLGDMRRVVVAAVGANRHFGVDGVNADDLAWLFDTAGWRKPGNFTQTLRNAARSKFGWLERIPGRSGRYAATPLGISKTLTAS